MKNKQYFVVFLITSIGQHRERCYIGKQITTFPRDRYYGEDDCPSLAQAIRRLGKPRFKKEILMLCENEQQMHAEHERLVNAALEKYTWKYYNKAEEKKPRPRSDETNRKQSETMTNRFSSGDLTPWNKGVVRYFRHGEEFKRRRSEEYRGENNPNYRHGRHVKSD